MVTAFLQAYLDILDYDGMKSVLKEADLMNIKDSRDVDPNDSIEFVSFYKIIDAQNLLLFGCYRLLYEVGKKLAFYLFPYGKDFEEIVEEITDLIKTNWSVEIVEKNVNSMTVEIENCVFCGEAGVPCNLFTGFLVQSLKKALPDNRRVIYSSDKEDAKESEPNSFILKLRWKK